LCARLFDVPLAQIKCTDQSDQAAPFQGKRIRHRRKPPTGSRLSDILFAIQNLNIFLGPHSTSWKVDRRARQQRFPCGFPLRSQDTELTIALRIFVFSYAFAILLSMMGIAAEAAMDPRRWRAPSDQHGFLLR
jgi:hypothetical protein